jgi:hypothetical protein
LVLLCTAPKPLKLEKRDTLRLALPSKGRMAEDTLQLLKASGQQGWAVLRKTTLPVWWLLHEQWGPVTASI